MPSFRQRKGQETPRERPGQVVPVPETPEGVYYPYRGSEDHGVPQPKNVDVDEYYETEEWATDESGLQILPAEAEPEPIPVKIVSESARERKMWRAIRYSANENPSRMIGRNDRRILVKIRNRGSNPGSVYIGEGNNVNSVSSYVLGLNNEMIIETTEEIWCITDAGDVCDLLITEEYRIEL